jgi:Protein of unknown function (DUF3365)
MKTITFFLLLIFIAFACNNNGKKSKNEQQLLQQAATLAKGDKIVKITFDTLKNILVQTISEKGLAQAVRFCNLKALPITGTYAMEGITISRVTDKTRNPKNSLADADKITWDNYKNLLANNDSLKPVVVSRNNEHHYYKPILMQSMCLNCHGNPGKEIPMDLVPVIDSLYPSDKAKGYKTGDLRGMWHIVFAEK